MHFYLRLSTIFRAARLRYSSADRHRVKVPALRMLGLLVLAVLTPTEAYASIFQGETLDKVANVMSWVVLVVAPTACIIIFWLIHILPEKIAEKNGHPQAAAIKTLCLLSLFFGGLLWPLAWLWAYSRPVLYKMAYGTDIAPGHGEGAHAASTTDAKPTSELEQLRIRVAEIEAALAKAQSQGGRA